MFDGIKEAGVVEFPALEKADPRAVERLRRAAFVKENAEEIVALAPKPQRLAAKVLLKRARKLIAKPELWCQRNYAVDQHGLVVQAESKDAVRFCAVGALRNVSNSPRSISNSPPRPVGWGEGDPIYLALQAMTGVIGQPIDWYNDEHGHAEVLAMLDEASALLTA